MRSTTRREEETRTRTRTQTHLVISTWPLPSRSYPKIRRKHRIADKFPAIPMFAHIIPTGNIGTRGRTRANAKTPYPFILKSSG